MHRILNIHYLLISSMNTSVLPPHTTWVGGCLTAIVRHSIHVTITQKPTVKLNYFRWCWNNIPPINKHLKSLHNKYISILRMSITLTFISHADLNHPSINLWTLITCAYINHVEHDLVHWNPLSIAKDNHLPNFFWYYALLESPNCSSWIELKWNDIGLHEYEARRLMGLIPT